MTSKNGTFRPELQFTPPVALASLSGQSDAEWARNGSAYAGCAFLGGIAIDEKTRAAARELVARDRCEFLPPDPIAFVDEQLTAVADVPIQTGVNIRTASREPLTAVADRCRRHGAILEINAHCRQDEICAVGAGETLLRETERLCEQVETASSQGACVSVKVRTEVPGVELPSLATAIEQAGADSIHVDAMDSESVIEAITQKTEMMVIANNGVRDRETVFEYLDYGADAVSVGRPSDNPAVLDAVHTATAEWFANRGELHACGDD